MLWRKRTLKTPQLARRRRRMFFLKVAGVFVLCLLFVGGVVYLLNREEVLFERVVVSGAEVLDARELETFAAGHLEGKYLFTIPRSNIFLYPKYTIAANVFENYKRLKDVEVERENWRTLRVSVVEREPHTQWCGENRLEGVVPECYFLDEDGYIYALAPTFSDDVYFHFYGPLGSGEPIGQFFLERSEYRSLSLFLSTLREDDIAVQDLAVRDEMDYELYLKGDVQVIFGRKQDLGRVYENLKSVLLSEAFKDVELHTLQYIDLRFGNKVYYKFRDSEEMVTEDKEERVAEEGGGEN